MDSREEGELSESGSECESNFECESGSECESASECEFGSEWEYTDACCRISDKAKRRRNPGFFEKSKPCK